MLEKLPERIKRRINDTGYCWEWTGYVTKKGYGEGYLNGKRIPAHRVTYLLLIGDIETGLQLDHLCRNRKCVNPNHLEPVTPKENVMRGNAPSAMYAKRTHCSKGHPLSGENVSYQKTRGRRIYRRCKICAYNDLREWRNIRLHNKI